jgi:ParB/RepB/Spo0J family partition protein
MTAAKVETRTGQVRMITLSDLRVAPWNARKTIDLAVLKSFIETIKAHGIQVPLIVRPYIKWFYVSAGSFGGPEGSVRYLACKNAVGHENLVKTFSGGTAEENQAAAEAAVAEENGRGDFEIVAGHRRFKAASILKLAELPCIVRELDDVAAREVGLIDNLQREDVPALEEADGFADLMDQLGSIAAVATRVGKEQGYVAKSLKLRTLTDPSRLALREKLITIDHARLLARLGEDEQNAALKWCLNPQAGSKTSVDDVIAERVKRKNPAAARAAIAADNPGVDLDDDDLETLRREEEDDFEDEETGRRSVWSRAWDPESVQRLKEHIESESGIPLDRAPWPMEEDWLLPDVGSCLDCPKNTKANAPLFGDLDIGVAVCTDGGCFKAKVTGFVELQQRDAAKAAAEKAKIPGKTGADFQILRLSWKATSTVPRQLKDGGGANPAQIFKDGQWEEADKKTCEHTRAAVTVDWSDANNRGFMGGSNKLRKPGEILRVCVEPGCKVHPKAYEKPAARAQQGGVDPEKQRRAMERFSRFVDAEKPVRRAVYDAVLAKIKPDVLKRNALFAMQQNFGICYADGFEGDTWNEREEHAAALIKKASGMELDALLFHATFGRFLVVDGGALNAKDKGRGQLRDLAKVAGVDAAAIERKFDKPEKPKPAPAKKAAKTAAGKATKKKGAAKKRGGK